MARGINKVILIGHLGQDPQVRHTQDNRPVTRLRVATTDTWKDRVTGERRESTEWHNVVCFGQTAEFAEQYLHKGSLVYAEGSLRTSSYEREGVKHHSTDVIARTVNILDSRRSGDMNDGHDSYPSQSGADRGGAQKDPQVNQDSAFEDDIPF